jgi:hypothetical protein
MAILSKTGAIRGRKHGVICGNQEERIMQIRKVYVLAIGIICAGLADAANVTYGTSANWSSKTVNDIDTVVINGGATVALDTSDTATIVRVSNGLTDGTLKIDQNNTLTVLTDFQLGTSTGSGVVTQSAGTVTARHLQINQSGTSAASRYYLSGGQITSTGTVTVATNAQLNISGGKMISSALTANSGGTVNLTGGVLDMAGTLTANGTVTINGGTLSNNIAGAGAAGRIIAGTDSVKMLSGSYALTGGAATDAVNINVALFEISGGDVDLMGQVRVGPGAELKVVGDAATINVLRLNNQGTYTGTFRFVLDETGVSTINSAGFINLSTATIIVDGTEYLGTAGTFDLFKGTTLSGLADTNNIIVSGFGSFGGAYVTQDAISGLVQLTVIPEPATVGLFIVASGGLMLLRRLHR